MNLTDLRSELAQLGFRRLYSRPSRGRVLLVASRDDGALDVFVELTRSTALATYSSKLPRDRRGAAPRHALLSVAAAHARGVS